MPATADNTARIVAIEGDVTELKVRHATLDGKIDTFIATQHAHNESAEKNVLAIAKILKDQARQNAQRDEARTAWEQEAAKIRAQKTEQEQRDKERERRDKADRENRDTRFRQRTIIATLGVVPATVTAIAALWGMQPDQAAIVSALAEHLSATGIQVVQPEEAPPAALARPGEAAQ